MRNQSPKKAVQPTSRPCASLLESGYVRFAAPPSDAGADVEIDWVKVEMLRAAIERGGYEVDPFAVAEAMIDRARGGD